MQPKAITNNHFNSEVHINTGEGRGEEGREGRGRMGGEGGRDGGMGGRVGMTVVHILMAPQYLYNNHVTYYEIT